MVRNRCVNLLRPRWRAEDSKVSRDAFLELQVIIKNVIKVFSRSEAIRLFLQLRALVVCSRTPRPYIPQRQILFPIRYSSYASFEEGELFLFISFDFSSALPLLHRSICPSFASSSSFLIIFSAFHHFSPKVTTHERRCKNLCSQMLVCSAKLLVKLLCFGHR